MFLLVKGLIQASSLTEVKMSRGGRWRGQNGMLGADVCANQSEQSSSPYEYFPAADID